MPRRPRVVLPHIPLQAINAQPLEKVKLAIQACHRLLHASSGAKNPGC